jgi:hypothetical protein
LSTALQEDEHIVGHSRKLTLAERLAVEIQVFGEPVDSLDQAQVGAPDEGDLPDIRRCGKMVEHQQLHVLLEDVLLEDRLVTQGRGVEALDGVDGDHSPYTLDNNRARFSSAAQWKRAASDDYQRKVFELLALDAPSWPKGCAQ